MRTGISSICHEPVVRTLTHQDGRTEGREVRCNTAFKMREIAKKVCVSCGRAPGEGHVGPDCVATGAIRYLPVVRKGAFCDEGHPYPVG